MSNGSGGSLYNALQNIGSAIDNTTGLGGAGYAPPPPSPYQAQMSTLGVDYGSWVNGIAQFTVQEIKNGFLVCIDYPPLHSKRRETFYAADLKEVGEIVTSQCVALQLSPPGTR